MNPINIQVKNGTVAVDGIRELNATNSSSVRDTVRCTLSDNARTVELDLSEMSFIDCFGLGTLLAVHRMAREHMGNVRLLNPTPAVQQILELTRMHRLFPIVRREPVGRTSSLSRRV